MIPSLPTNPRQGGRQPAPPLQEDGKRPPLAQQDPDAQVHIPSHPQLSDPAYDELDDPVNDRTG